MSPPQSSTPARKTEEVVRDRIETNTSDVAPRIDVDRKVVPFAPEELKVLGAAAGAQTAPLEPFADDYHPDAREVRTSGWRLGGGDEELAAPGFKSAAALSNQTLCLRCPPR
jgi:hypothetical protein